MNGKAAIRIVLVDDQPLLRLGFRLTLEEEDGLEVVGEASDGAEALQQVQKLDPDVVLMDVRMPVLDGIRATRAISASGSHARVIILTSFDVDDYAFAGLQAGASAFLLKDVAPMELRQAVRVVASGNAVVSPRVTRRLLETYVRSNRSAAAPGQPDGGRRQVTAHPRDPLLEELTPREIEMLESMTEGLSNAEIAGKFFLSEATVKTHVSSILTKLHLRDRLQAVVYAYEKGLVLVNNRNY